MQQAAIAGTPYAPRIFGRMIDVIKSARRDFGEIDRYQFVVGYPSD
ncbi:MAG TPA: hypothetical protein VJX48_00940 [Xanthobacteraceae bacterium]|nr:hypothetical protein [Xanthobacteraceae bacterium]